MNREVRNLYKGDLDQVKIKVTSKQAKQRCVGNPNALSVRCGTWTVASSPTTGRASRGGRQGASRESREEEEEEVCCETRAFPHATSLLLALFFFKCCFLPATPGAKGDCDLAVRE